MNLLPGANPGLPSRPSLPIGAAAAALQATQHAGQPAPPQAAFAEDLAQLLALNAVIAEGLPTQAAPDVTVPTTEPEETPPDALAALWIELGITAPPPTPNPAAHHARGPATSPPGLAIAAQARPGALRELPPGLALHAAGGNASSNQPLAGVPLDLAAQIETRPVAPDTAVGLPFALTPEPPRANPLPAAPLVLGLRHPQASQQLAENVVWQVGKELSEVQIRMNPEDLGPLEVRLKLEGDKVAVRFDMADASVRDVVQTSLPQLATMLSARGLQLDQAQVFQQDRGQPQTPFQPPQHSGAEADSGDDADAARTPRVAVRRGLVDDYV